MPSPHTHACAHVQLESASRVKVSSLEKALREAQVCVRVRVYFLPKRLGHPGM